MKRKSDDHLGMGATITRRDLCQGIALALGAAPLLSLPRETVAALLSEDYYPPALTGLRGSHVGSFEVAHALSREGKVFPRPKARTDDVYDLVIVGAGISGLAAAWYYRRLHAGARILLLDNHDDFGGHARRNEFQYQGRTLLCHGGSQSIDTPRAYSQVAKDFLRDLGVDTQRFHSYYDREFTTRHGLTTGIFFDREHWGRTALSRGARSGWDWETHDPAALAAATPLGDAARRDLVRLMTDTRDYLPQNNRDEKLAYLAHTTYNAFLLKDAGVDQSLLPLFNSRSHGLWGVGPDALSALEMYRLGFPGFAGMDLGTAPNTADHDEPYIFHFPDGNASIARMLVRALIPATASGNTMEDIVTAPMHYATLDRPDHAVRIRLNSTAVNVVEGREGVDVTYVQDGATLRVTGRAAVLACHHAIIPYICPQLPQAQKEALSLQVKVPLLWTSVLLDNWRALKKLGIGSTYSPTDFHSWWSMDFPVSMGGYQYTQSPDDPVVLYMIHAANGPVRGLPAREQYRNGRMELLNTPFATLEWRTRRQLAETLGPGGFDPERDIRGITVNRWPHGYAYEYIELWDPSYARGQAPHEIARVPFGRVAIANSDAEAHAYVDGAIDAAHRAVQYLAGAETVREAGAEFNSVPV